VARALAQEADLLILDEPTSSLDPEHQVGVFAMLHGLVERGRAALIATHELSLVSQFASRAILMQGGRIVAEGAPAEVLIPAVLRPVYGQNLWYAEASGGRPVVVPWRRDDDLGGKL
jgi:iron complex transport system ATP-binding protein